MEFSKIKSKSFAFLAWTIKTRGKEVSTKETESGVVRAFIYNHRRIELLEVQDLPMQVKCGTFVKIRE